MVICPFDFVGDFEYVRFYFPRHATAISYQDFYSFEETN